MNIEIKRGDIFIADLPKNEGSRVQYGKRPVIVLSNNKANEFSPVIHIVPLTTKMFKSSIPTHVIIGLDCGITKKSLALVEQSQLLDKNNLTQKIGKCTDEVMEDINDAVDIQFKGITIRKNSNRLCFA